MESMFFSKYLFKLEQLGIRMLSAITANPMIFIIKRLVTSLFTFLALVWGQMGSLVNLMCV